MRDRLSPVGQAADRQTQAVARAIHAARLAAIQDETERNLERDRGSYGPDYAGVSAFAEELDFHGFRVQEATAMAMATGELRDELERLRRQIVTVMDSPSGATSTPTWAQLANARAITSGALVNLELLAERQAATRDHRELGEGLLERLSGAPGFDLIRAFLLEDDRLAWAIAGARNHRNPDHDDEALARAVVDLLGVGARSVENSVDKSGQPDEKSTAAT